MKWCFEAGFETKIERAIVMFGNTEGSEQLLGDDSWTYDPNHNPESIRSTKLTTAEVKQALEVAVDAIPLAEGAEQSKAVQAAHTFLANPNTGALDADVFASMFDNAVIRHASGGLNNQEFGVFLRALVDQPRGEEIAKMVAGPLVQLPKPEKPGVVAANPQMQAGLCTNQGYGAIVMDR